MTSALRSAARLLIPRSVRNWLRSPRQAIEWNLNQIRGPIDFRIRPDWPLRCPRNAAHRAFNLQIDDPPQAVEFDDYLEFVRDTGRVALLDIGCHFGVFCFASVHYGAPGSHAIGVDPSREAHAMVETIARLNRMQDRIRFIEAAAGATVGSMEMVETGLTGAGYVVLPRDQPKADRRTIPVLTLDSLAEQFPGGPTVVKIDVESFELDVLKGGPKTLGERGTPLFIELHNAMMREREVDPATIIRQLQDYGYRSFKVGNRSYRPEDLVREDILRVLARRE